MSRAIRVFLDREVVVGIVVAVVVSILIAPVAARKLSINRLAAYLGVLSAMLVLAVTIFDRVEGIPGFDLGRALTWWTKRRQPILDIARSEPGWWLNVALFVPAGVVWSSITRRPLVVIACLVGYSFGIETLQASTGLGASDVSDLVANSLGAIVGAAAIWVVLRVAPRAIPDVSRPLPDSQTSHLGPTWIVGSVLATTLVFGAGFLGVQAVLASRQAALRREVERVFAGLTIQDINEIREPDAVALSPFFDLVSVRPDSYRFYDDNRPVEVRYPVDFLGAYRCVFVTFSESAPSFANASGTACTEDRYELSDG